MDPVCHPRELTNREKRKIKQLVICECANYDVKYGCLPLDGGCYMLGKCYTGHFCRYFQEALLPSNPALQGMLMRVNLRSAERICAICGTRFRPITKQTYCSSSCRSAGKREINRQRQRKWQKKRG